MLYNIRMRKFIGRKRELEVLSAAYDSQDSAFIPIYGRRRVGKSELIRNFLQSKRSLYFVGKQARADLLLREFLQEAANVIDEPLLAELPTTDWSRAIVELEKRWPKDEKIVIALDEFQWLVAESPELPSILQELWDKSWQHSGRVMLIICGSYIGFMEREVLGRKSPLYGRRTAQILLKPFSYREAKEFHPSYSFAEAAKARAICGGIPLYLNMFEPGHSVETNIIKSILDETAPLRHEPDFLLREELRDVENYSAILFAISTGSLAVRDIAKATGIDSRALSYLLKQLVGIGYVSKRYPLSHSKPSARDVRYCLDDPLLKFWFSFVYPNESFIARTPPRDVFHQRIKSRLDAYYGQAFERLCREALPDVYQQENISSWNDVGEFWSKKAQIDVVGLRSDGWTDLAECKWGKIKSAEAIEHELMAKAQHFPCPNDVTINLRVFAKSVTKRQRNRKSGVTWHSLDDLYKS